MRALKSLTRWSGLLIALSFTACILPPNKLVVKNLGNPTEYLFHVKPQAITNAFRYMAKGGLTAEHPWCVLNRRQEGHYVLLIEYHISPTYWSGPTTVGWRESEAGQVAGAFEIDIVEKDSCTVVSLVREDLNVRWAKIPNIVHSPNIDWTFREVPSNTFFEYQFLCEVGQLVGETNMPPIRIH